MVVPDQYWLIYLLRFIFLNSCDIENIKAAPTLLLFIILVYVVIVCLPIWLFFSFKSYFIWAYLQLSTIGINKKHTHKHTKKESCKETCGKTYQKKYEQNSLLDISIIAEVIVSN